jgi:hypothetical protein
MWPRRRDLLGLTTDVIFVVMTTKAASKAVYLRGLPPEIVREAKAAAARRGVTLAGFVAETLTRALEQLEALPGGDRGNDMKRDQRWFERNRERLLRKYVGEYVAIVGEAVIDHDTDFEPLAERVFASQGVRDIFMPLVSAGQPAARVRSPRVLR